LSAASKWREVTEKESCPLCDKSSWCARSADGAAISCNRTVDAPTGWVRVKQTQNGGVFKRSETKTSTFTSLVNWAHTAETCKDAISSDRLTQLATELGVTIDSLRTIGIGWAEVKVLREWHASGDGWKDDYPNGAFTFPEHGGDGKVVGLSLRAEDGRKGAPSGKKTGAKRGLIVPTSLARRQDPILIVEGATDVAALETLGLAAVGRPSNTSGGKDLAGMLRGRAAIVVGERDQKPDGSWPGRDGAARVAGVMASTWKRPVPHSLPPIGSKDVREWVRSQVPDLTNDEARSAASESLVAALRAGVETAEPRQEPSQAELLVQLALERYRIGRDNNGEAFAVELDGPNIALMFSGTSARALRAALAREFRQRQGNTPNSSSLHDALTVLEGESQLADREPVHLRVAEHEGGVVLDLGSSDGKAMVVKKGRWEIASTSPVLFRRTALTGQLPVPQKGGSIDELRALLNVGDESWTLVLAWLVAALIPNAPHPVLMLGGLHGTGKTTAARLIVSVVDPSPAPTRSPPKTDRDWAVTAFASWTMVFDNISAIAIWWSDALCKCVTGDGYPFRTLFTDRELTVIAFRRAVIMTSIDPGALRGDLGDRLMLVDLEPIDDKSRRTEKEIEGLFASCQPRVLGALLDIVAQVLEELPSVKLDGMPRLADFACVVAAMDKVLGTNALDLFLGQRERIADEVIEADSVGVAVMTFMASRDLWISTPKALLEELTPDEKKDLPSGWPKNPRALTAALKRLLPAFKSVGLRVVLGERLPGGDRDRQVSIMWDKPSGGGTVGEMRDGRPSPDRPGENGPGSAPDGLRDGRDGRDGSFQLSQGGGSSTDRGDERDIDPPRPAENRNQPSRQSRPSLSGPGEPELAVEPGRSRDGRPQSGTVGQPTHMRVGEMFDVREVDDVG
jgi:hypothetical protein